MAARRPIAVELFCGVGGMTLGFERAGFKVAAAVDSDAINVEYHALNFPKCKAIRGDLTGMAGAEIRSASGIGDKSISVVFGGPPCQGFSLIGKRNAKDKRNQLIFRFIALVAELNADYFVMENVRGLTVGHAREMLASFVRRAKRMGYDVVEPVRVLDASEHGVPQRRQRVFVLGYKRGLAPPVYPEKFAGIPPTVLDALGDLPDIDGHTQLFESDTIEVQLGQPSDYARELRKGKGAMPAAVNGHKVALSGCLLTRHSPATTARFSRTKPGHTEPVSRFHRLDPNGVASTLRAGTGPERGSYMAARPIHPVSNRCITTREAARLHSYPDWFRFHPTKWHGFRQIGNSVPPSLAQAVAESLFTAISTHQS